MTIVLVCVVFALVSALLIWRFHKAGWESRRLVCLGLFLLSLLMAWVVRRFAAPAVSAQPIPLYKLFHISEYGYQSFLSDLMQYALVYLAVGILLTLSFPSVGVGISMLAGLCASLLFALPHYATGAPFVADELVFAALGAGTGAGLLILFTVIFKNKPWLTKLGLTAPKRSRFWSGLLVCAALYLGIAFTMIADYGTTYGELQLFRGATPLPESINVQAELSSEQKKVPIYAASEKDQLLLASEIARAFGMEGDFTEVDGKYVIASGDGGLFTYTPGNGWNYEFISFATGEVPDVEEGEALAREYFSGIGLAGTMLGDAIDAVIKDNTQLIGAYNEESGLTEQAYAALLEEAKKPIGVDIYFRTMVDGYSIIGDNEIMISVRSGGVVTRVRKTGCEIEKVANCKIISPADAWKKFLAGEGSHSLYEEIESATLTDFELAYMLESAQGNYLPVWCFRFIGTRSDGSTLNFEGYVPAMR